MLLFEFTDYKCLMKNMLHRFVKTGVMVIKFWSVFFNSKVIYMDMAYTFFKIWRQEWSGQVIVHSELICCAVRSCDP